MVSSVRYSRQEAVAGWDQEAFKKAKVILVGSGRLSDFILVGLLSLGFGQISRIGYSDFLEFNKINPDIYLEQTGEDVVNLPLAQLHIRDADFVIEATNNLESKYFSGRAAESKGIGYISCSCTKESFSFYSGKISDDLLSFHYADYDLGQGLISSVICAAMATDELRKMVLPLEGDRQLKNFRYSGIKEIDSIDKKILQVGAGAIGTFTALALAILGVDLTIADFDKAQESNLNRQFLFYDSLGQNKAEILANRLEKYSPKIKSVQEKIKDDFDPRGYDFIFSCVDNNRARYFMNLACLKYRVPLINGGSSISAGNVIPCLPGQTACLDCQSGFKLTQRPKKKKARRPGECFQPSLIIPNQVVAGLMVNCLVNALGGIHYKSLFVSGEGIFEEGVNSTCFNLCRNKEG
jgi:molybdopterin/thiamine biosynthesis adenylyltransferase